MPKKDKNKVGGLVLKVGHKYRISGGYLDGREYYILAIAEERVMYRHSVRENWRLRWEYAMSKLWVLKAELLNSGSYLVDCGKFEYIEGENEVNAK